MSLTKDDLAAIKEVVTDSINEAIDILVIPRFDAMEGRMDKLELRMDALEKRVSSLEVAQKETNLRLTQLVFAQGSILGRLEALENDVKELYRTIQKREHFYIGGPKYRALSNKQKLAVLYGAVNTMARSLGMTFSD